MSVLGNIQGKTGENISTEILAHFLSPEEGFVPFQRLFFSHVLSRPSSSRELDIQHRTQVDLGRTGIPDFVMLCGDGETIIILENKLGSYLSGDSQLLRYAEAFKKEKDIKGYFSLFRSAAVNKRVLVFLAPRKAIDISLSTTDRVFNKKYKMSFRDYLGENNIELRTVDWETVIGWLDKKDSLQNELFRFVEDFLNVELTEGEEMVLLNPETPNSLLKLFKNIANITNDVIAKDWKVSRMTQSYIIYGFYIETGLTKLYFGYSLLTWQEFGTPVILQAAEGDFRLDKNVVSRRLSENGFVYGKDNKLVRPFMVESINSWKKELLDILENLRGEEPATPK